MKRISLILILSLAATLPAHADEASRRLKAQEMVNLLHMDRLMKQMMDGIMQQVNTATRQFAGSKITPAQQAQLDAFQVKVFALMDSRMGWKVMEPTYVDLYAKTFTDGLAPINAAIAHVKATYPGAPVGYTERVPGYLVDAAGLKLATPASFAQSIEDGNDPSPADNAAMDAALTTRAIKVLLYNGQVTSPATDAVKQLAQKSGVPVVGVTETLPPTDKDFQAWQLRQITELTTALGG